MGNVLKILHKKIRLKRMRKETKEKDKILNKGSDSSYLRFSNVGVLNTLMCRYSGNS